MVEVQSNEKGQRGRLSPGKIKNSSMGDYVEGNFPNSTPYLQTREQVEQCLETAVLVVGKWRQSTGYIRDRKLQGTIKAKQSIYRLWRHHTLTRILLY